MIKYIFPSILVAIALSLFFVFTMPQYNQIQDYKNKISQYDSALSNEARFERDRDALSSKFHNFPIETNDRLNRMLPDNVQNIQLVIALQQIAQSFGMTISAINFDTVTAATTTSGGPLPVTTQASNQNSNKDYGVFNLSFTVTGPYENFLNFLKKMESSLRILDIQSVGFSADSTSAKNSYTYTIRLKTYWLKAM